jgi:hypothetical protein
MSSKTKHRLILAVFITILLAGCRCDNSLIPTYFGIADTPSDGAVTSLTPSFNWHGSDTCDPDEYLFRIEEGGISSLGLVNTNISPSNLPYTYVGGVGSDLEPGKSYTWYLTAINGSNNGDPPVFGPKTEIGQFFTGPVCSGEVLVAPDLLDPEPAGWVEDDPYLFKWTYEGDCLPESYEIQFALDPGFTTISMTVNTTEPYAQELLMTFLDCTTLFWRVRASDGTSFGPWSDGRDFHYILSGGCYQWHYMSDDYAWINVRLYEDNCDQTGYIAAWTAAPLHTGCMVDGMIIVGDGTSFSSSLKDFTVDLGAGPCPSTGLDQKNGGGNVKFGVLTPGTYCVTISRDQTVDDNGPLSLMDGIWTGPRSNQIVVEETIDFGPGNHDYIAYFVWDEIDRPLLTFPLDYTYACKIGPEKNCPTYDFAMEGDAIPILARDANSDWKLTELNGIPCYILLGNAAINEKLNKYEGFERRADDLEIFLQPDPCPKPETKADPDPGITCSDYSDAVSCRNARCNWYPVNDKLSLCVPYQ